MERHAKYTAGYQAKHAQRGNSRSSQSERLFVVQRGDVLFLRRKTQSTIQHCAVDDATSTVLLTVQLLKDAAEVHGLKSLEETSPPKSEWPPNGNNIRTVSIDTESCVVPKDMTPLRGYKYAQYMIELGVAFIDVDTICAHHHDRALEKK
ncbi:hypothetical protein M438DRAFT_144298 [Aureobasidium pullulans EXF-150]|uniref:Uncharacterized protein n=1 Tax=Aureobasidium pullulans EXF-150 TaxID=1043002 RepID=A0A074XCA1_AURPU|nr:uncharacterized protein M438DRAFT_144298 [Aureobasidium pullulans EXF-150]KEQ79642.1 hypothetical protein M438DRAFT_144298 [Aureobasidium pullulans EXF-150]